jgi:replicative DNA helicase
MKAAALLARFAAIQTGIPIERIRQPSKFLDQSSFQRVVEAAGKMSEYPIRIDDDFSATLSDIRSRALAMHNEVGSVGLVVVDYIGQINSPGVSEENRTREVSKFSRGLKALAGELNCPVLALAQFNRGANQRQGDVPRLSDLKETSSLEQDADVVLILHRPELYNANAPRGVLEVHIAKQRQGPLGKVSLSYEPDTGRFSNVTYRTPVGF